jgi:hypothetical protein
MGQMEVGMRYFIRRTLPGLLLIFAVMAGCNLISPTSSPAPIPASANYEYWVTGGFAGIVEHTVFDSTGLAQLSYPGNSKNPNTSYTYKLTLVEFDSLKSAFESADFLRLHSSYAAGQPIVDGFDLRVVCNFGSGAKTVSVEANASVPSGLSNLLRYLNSLNATIQSKGQRS